MEKSKKMYGRGENITRSRELAKELRDAVKVAIESWATSAREALLMQGYSAATVENALTKITDTAYESLAWKTLHRGEGYKDPYHERELAEFLAEHPDGEVRETRIGFRHLSWPVFKKEDIERAGLDIPALFEDGESDPKGKKDG